METEIGTFPAVLRQNFTIFLADNFRTLVYLLPAATAAYHAMRTWLTWQRGRDPISRKWCG